MKYTHILGTAPLALALLSCTTAPDAAAKPAEIAMPAELPAAQRFEQWKGDFITRAAAKGYSPQLVRGLIGPAVLRESAIKSDQKQPEFTKPVWAYVDTAASATRLNTGKTKLRQTSAVFDAVEGRYRVPRHILTAIWGLETAYGSNLGSYNPVDALATLAFEGRRQTFGENQLFALLDLLRAGDVRMDQLKSSWAGAMGMTQFIPTTFRDYAVDFDGDGNKDLWTSEADALGSAAHYLARSGWRAGEPVMTEVKLPEGFDYGLAETAKKTVNDWTALGVAPFGGQRWSADAGFLDAKLLAPAGHRGPKFLTFKNFDVIRRYNNSTSYIMGVTVLGEALRGRPAIRAPWPRDDEPLSLTQREQLQSKLTALGFDTGGVDGQIGPNSRKAIRAWQKSIGVPADGYMEKTLWARLMRS